jgi:hypothetical protein
MTKHYYVHMTQRPEHELIHDDENFITRNKLPRSEAEKCHQNEFGVIKTETSSFHLLIGKVLQKGCPWCGCEALKMRTWQGPETLILHNPTYCCLECCACHSRGPVHASYNHATLCDEDALDFQNRIKIEYTRRHPWDANLENPYNID